MTDVPENLSYTAEHEWVAFDPTDPTLAKVGITPHAADALGDLVYVQLPSPGDDLTAGGICGELESTKTVSDLYSPLTGETVEINTTLGDDPSVINSDAYNTGWLFSVRFTGKGELLTAAEYTALIENE